MQIETLESRMLLSTATNAAAEAYGPLSVTVTTSDNSKTGLGMSWKISSSGSSLVEVGTTFGTYTDSEFYPVTFAHNDFVVTLKASVNINSPQQEDLRDRPVQSKRSIVRNGIKVSEQVKVNRHANAFAGKLKIKGKNFPGCFNQAPQIIYSYSADGNPDTLDVTVVVVGRMNENDPIEGDLVGAAFMKPVNDPSDKYLPSQELIWRSNGTLDFDHVVRSPKRAVWDLV